MGAVSEITDASFKAEVVDSTVPVLIDFWGPNCPPCRDEFPLFKAKLAEHAADRLAIIGVLMWDPPEP